MGRLNNMSYNQSINAVKLNGVLMKVFKRLLKKAKSPEDQRIAQQHITRVKREINLLLSVIHAHKAARKLYAENQRLRKELDEKK